MTISNTSLGGFAEKLRQISEAAKAKEHSPPSEQPVPTISPPNSTNHFPLAKIRANGGTQVRAAINEETVKNYMDVVVGGADFPPVVVFHDGSDHWLADGFHRFHAYRAAGRDSIPAEVRQGTRRDAVLYSVGANATHGLPRTNADKRRAVQTLLNDEEWVKWSDREIARRCHVDNKTVATVRARMLSEEIPQMRSSDHGSPGGASGELPQMDAVKVDSASGNRCQMDAGPTGASDNGLQMRSDAPTPEPTAVIPASTLTTAAESPVPAAPATRKVERGGKTFEMKTENIGKGSKGESKPRDDSTAIALPTVPTRSGRALRDFSIPTLATFQEALQRR